MGETYKHFPYSSELATEITKQSQSMKPVLPAISADCVVTKVDEIEPNKYQFDIHQLTGSQDTIHITRWQKDPVTDEDISQSVHLSEMLDKILERRMQSSSLITATMMCAAYREGIREYRETCCKISEYLVDELKKDEVGLYTKALISLFGYAGYTFFRDLAYSHHPELADKMCDKMLKDTADKFKENTTIEEEPQNG